MDCRGLTMPIMMGSEHQQALLIMEKHRAFLIEQNQQILADLRGLQNQNQSAAGSIVSHGLPLLAAAGSPVPPPTGIMTGGGGPNFQGRMMQITQQEQQMQAGIPQDDCMMGFLSTSLLSQQIVTTNAMQQNERRFFLGEDGNTKKRMGYPVVIPSKDDDVALLQRQQLNDDEDDPINHHDFLITGCFQRSTVSSAPMTSETSTYHDRGSAATSFPEWNAPDSHEEGRHHATHQELYTWEAKTKEGGVANNPILYVTSDDRFLSEYQCLVRKQIEVFEVGPDELGSNAQGRNKPIVAGQVGVRCRHCSTIPTRHRTRGASYYPAQLKGIYQAAQNMASAHLLERCQLIPEDLRMELARLHNSKSLAGGGKPYWAKSAASLGIVEVDGTIRFKTPE
jgi:hypothetical protein